MARQIDAAAGGDESARAAEHVLDRLWGYDPAPLMLWGDATTAWGDRSARRTRIDAWTVWWRAHCDEAVTARRDAGVQQSVADLGSTDLATRWRALERLLRRVSDRANHAIAVSALQALWRQRNQLPPEARRYMTAQIAWHMSDWRLPQDRSGNLSVGAP
ncbi:MAG: hypothetical protein WCJ30_11525 [Deltaproteobacteria bacterium]